MPDVDDVAGPRRIAFLVEPDLAEHGREASLGEGGGDLVEIGRAGGVRGGGPDLDGGVGAERIAFRLDAGLAEAVDDLGRLRVLAGVRREGQEGAVGGVAGGAPIVLGEEIVAADDHGLQGAIAHLLGDQGSVGVVAADIEDVDIGLLDPRHQLVEVAARRLRRSR